MKAGFASSSREVPEAANASALSAASERLTTKKGHCSQKSQMIVPAQGCWQIKWHLAQRSLQGDFQTCDSKLQTRGMQLL